MNKPTLEEVRRLIPDPNQPDYPDSTQYRLFVYSVAEAYLTQAQELKDKQKMLDMFRESAKALGQRVQELNADNQVLREELGMYQRHFGVWKEPNHD